mgnify:FL=1
MNAVINTPVATATYSAFCLGLRLINLAHALGQTHCLRGPPPLVQSPCAAARMTALLSACCPTKMGRLLCWRSSRAPNSQTASIHPHSVTLL